MIQAAQGPERDFSYASFRQLINAAQSRYEMCLFSEATSRLAEAHAKPLFFLRHDVDVSLKPALEMACLEAEMGVRATYMVLTHAEVYDIGSRKEAQLLHELRRHGHEVGLHFDIGAEGLRPDDSPQQIEHALRASRDRLAELLGEPVPAFSFHRPAPQFLRGSLLIAEMVSGYAAELMEDYISDSRAHWRAGDPLPHILAGPSSGVFQVLIHPIWWGKAHESGADRLRSFLEEHTAGRTETERLLFEAVLARAVPAVQAAQPMVQQHTM
jgi:hypothetical protein